MPGQTNDKWRLCFYCGRPVEKGACAFELDGHMFCNVLCAGNYRTQNARRKRTCYRCGKRLTKKEADSFVAGYPFPCCDKCAGWGEEQAAPLFRKKGRY